MAVIVKGIEILKRSAVSPEEFEALHNQLKGIQLPIKARRGKATYRIGELRKVVEGRDALLADIAFSTNFKLQMSGEGEEIAADFLEWKI